MDIIKKHADTLVIIGAICGSLLWMNGRFNGIDKEISELKTEIAVIKAVLLVKKILPSELAKETE